MDDAPESSELATSQQDASNERLPESSAAPTFWHIYRQSWLVLWGVVAPSIFLLLAAWFEKPDWQSGALGDYALLLYHWPHLLPVYPLVVFSTAGMCALIYSPERASRWPWVRFAVCTGVIVWIELGVIWFGGVERTFEPEFGMVVLFLGPFAGFLITLPFAAIAYGVSGSNKEWQELQAGSLVAGIFLLFCTIPIFGVWLFALVPAAPLAVWTFGWASYHSLSTIKRAERRISLKMLMVIVTWLSANFAAWRVSIDMMLATYATLPTEPPNDCFIASAAARGHRRFVGADRACINNQLRLLKAGELVLRHTTPRVHATLRWIYNRLGPRAARLIATRWLADLAYVGLKPCEWFALLLVHYVAGAPHERVKSLYRQ